MENLESSDEGLLHLGLWEALAKGVVASDHNNGRSDEYRSSFDFPNERVVICPNFKLLSQPFLVSRGNFFNEDDTLILIAIPPLVKRLRIDVLISEEFSDA